jgi:hypothetical protein
VGQSETSHWGQFSAHHSHAHSALWVGDGNGAAAREIRFSPDTIRGSVRFPQAADMSMLPRQSIGSAQISVTKRSRNGNPSRNNPGRRPYLRARASRRYLSALSACAAWPLARTARAGQARCIKHSLPWAADDVLCEGSRHTIWRHPPAEPARPASPGTGRVLSVPPVRSAANSAVPPAARRTRDAGCRYPLRHTPSRSGALDAACPEGVP